MRFISHRGAGGIADENSLKAIRLGESFDPSYVEVDVHETRDGVFVLYHGDLHLTYLGTPLDETFEELKKLVPNLLTLKDFLREPVSVPIIFDIKVKDHTDTIIDLLENSPSLFRRAFTSPHPAPLIRLKHAFPEADIMIAQPYAEGPFRPIELARKYKFKGISLNKWWLGPFTYHACNRFGLEMMVYTVDRPLTMRLVSTLFPRAIICTNRPDLFKKILGRRTARLTAKAKPSR